MFLFLAKLRAEMASRIFKFVTICIPHTNLPRFAYLIGSANRKLSCDWLLLKASIGVNSLGIKYGRYSNYKYSIKYAVQGV